MIVGQKILNHGLVVGGSAANLKNSTYDLTVGEIIPIGKDSAQVHADAKPIVTHYLEPREMVWILSKEEFRMPENITGFATLRTAFTKQGILALNVGMIDPLFHGPISTALINFSDRPRRIDVGDKFFRVAFFQHDSIKDFHGGNENISRENYLKELQKTSFADFSPSFLNIPKFDDNYYYEKFEDIVWHSIKKHKKTWMTVLIVSLVLIWFFIDKGLLTFLGEKFDWLGKIKLL